MDELVAVFSTHKDYYNFINMSIINVIGFYYSLLIEQGLMNLLEQLFL